MNNCKLCNSNFENIRKMSKHVRDKHKDYTVKQYYDEFIKSDGEGICQTCLNETNYSGLGDGYKLTCSNSCAAKLFKKKLKSDERKFNIFVKKISNSVKKQWETKDQTVRISKMKKTINDKLNSMSASEKIEKYGYLNKLPENEREKMIKLMTEKGFLNWWKNASFEQKTNAWNKRNSKLVSLWAIKGLELHKKQKDTFAKRLESNECADLDENELKVVFEKLDDIFNE